MKFISQQGFSILQGLVLSGLLAGSALVTSKLISNQKKVVVSAKSKDAADEMMDLLYNILQFQDNCSATLIQNGATALTGSPPLNNGIYFAPRSPSDAGLPVQQVVALNTSYLQNSISIDSMRIEYGATLSGLTPAQLVVNMKRFISTDPNLRTKDGVGGKDLTRRINIIIQRNESTLNFKSCYAVKTLSEDIGGSGTDGNIRDLCNNLSPLFYWNNTTNTCEVNNNTCPRDYFFAGISSTGVVARPTGVGWNNTEYITSSGIGAANCRYIRQAIRLDQFIRQDGTNCNGRYGVRWQKVGNQVRITCAP